MEEGGGPTQVVTFGDCGSASGFGMAIVILEWSGIMLIAWWRLCPR